MTDQQYTSYGKGENLYLWMFDWVIIWPVGSSIMYNDQSVWLFDQLPLDTVQAINTDKVLNFILPSKDVDG